MVKGLTEGLRSAGAWIARGFPRRSIGYWLTVVIILAVTTWTLPFVDAHLNLANERNWLFQHLTQSRTNPTKAREARLVLIKDDEFWDGELHHRTPTDRRYLARIVRALDEADASVIALDFDLRTSKPDVAVRPGDYGLVDSYAPYRDETDELIRAIDDVAQRRRIVLAKTIAGPDNGPFHLQSDAYQPYGICTRLVSDGVWANPGTPQFPLNDAAAKNISCGYIALMDDARRVPPPAAIVDQSQRVDAFPLAVARARSGGGLPSLGERPYFGVYISQAAASSPGITLSAHDLLRDPRGAGGVLQGWPVIVGAAWHQRAGGTGVMADIHDTPIGKVSGALLHYNLVEAVLSGRAYPGLDETELTVLEILVGAATAILFAWFESLRAKIVALASVMTILFFVQWLILQVAGVFFDTFVPVFSLGMHAILDRLVGEGEHGKPSRLDLFAAKLLHAKVSTKAEGRADAPAAHSASGE